MSSLPSVTIAIPTYNRARLLTQTLEGLTAQDYPRELLEILIIDNNSPDNTRAVVASFGSAAHPPRHILETQQGANFARNRALAEARGEIIVYGDDDILLPPDWLRELMQPFATDGAAASARSPARWSRSFPTAAPTGSAAFTACKISVPTPVPLPSTPCP
jgi:glycosyltransferase involved in cell wall biosynthesis